MKNSDSSKADNADGYAILMHLINFEPSLGSKIYTKIAEFATRLGSRNYTKSLDLFIALVKKGYAISEAIENVSHYQIRNGNLILQLVDLLLPHNVHNALIAAVNGLPPFQKEDILLPILIKIVKSGHAHAEASAALRQEQKSHPEKKHLNFNELREALGDNYVEEAKPALAPTPDAMS